MSSITTVTSTNNQLHVSYDLTKFLLGFNNFIQSDVTALGADVATLQGMVMGRISATELIVPLDSTATDGSQLPVGICMIDKTVADGTTATLTLVNKGRVAESLINFITTDTLATAVGPLGYERTYRDLLNDLGLILETSEELTAVDNS